MEKVCQIFLDACLAGELAAVKRILKRFRSAWNGRTTFDINCVDKNRRTGLMLACLSGCGELVEILTHRGEVDVNALDVFGATALMYSAQLEEEHCLLTLLIRRDLDIDEKDLDSKNAEDYARDLGRTKNVEIIREARAMRIRGSWSEAAGEEQEDIDEADVEEEEEKDDLESVLAIQSGDETTGDEKETNVKNIQLHATQLENSCFDSFYEERSRLQQNLNKLREDCESTERGLDTEQEEGRTRLEREHEASLDVLKQNIKQKREKLLEEYRIKKRSLEMNMKQLNLCIDKFDWKTFMRISNSVSELECPVCLEEMKPPLKIWQCVEGHPICDLCRRRPQLTACPVCRQDIAGRNILAEKIAASIFGD